MFYIYYQAFIIYTSCFLDNQLEDFKMRVGTTAILAGSTLSLLFAGCQNHNMLNTRGYIPAPESEYTAPSTPPAQSPGLVVETIPVKPKPSFEQEQNLFNTSRLKS